MLDLSQIAALVIFVLLFAAIIIGKIHRFIPALIAAALTLIIVFLLLMRSPEAIIHTLNLGQVVLPNFWVPGQEHVESQGINWQTIIFIGGMMAMVESMGEVGFFDWLCLSVAKLVKYRTIPIFVSFTVVSGVLAMFIDSITVLLFMTAIVIELARLLKIDPVPFIIAMVFAANTGGSATMSGDPPNIIIGTSLGLTFTDFLDDTGPVAWLGLFAALGFFFFSFRKSLTTRTSPAEATTAYPEPAQAISNRFLFVVNVVIFVFVILLLVTHASTGISVALIGVIAAVLTLAASRHRALHIIKRVDWRTLLFFIGLFVTVSGLEQTGVLKLLASLIEHLSAGNFVLVITIILWLSAVASAIVDNIPFAATMVPVIIGISQTSGLPLPPLAWALALGTDIGGNATPIGASANVVSTAIAEREGYPITWGRFLRYALPATLLVIGICWVYLVFRYT